MSTFESFRKVYGALKDSTKVGLAKVNSKFKDLDIAIVKATNHGECPPKERHVRKIILATSSVVPRADVAYCIHALYRRLSKTRNWIVAIKTLIVLHRTLREGDSSFREELLNYSERGLFFQTSNFKDDSSSLAWDCSTWVRTYGIFLEERLECYRILKYDIESEHLTRRSPGIGKGCSKTRITRSEELLEQLPAMQQLLYRLLRCQPEGAAYHNYLVQYALALVLKESFKIYCSINDGIINLVDMFFDMPKHETEKALNMYKKAGKQAVHLAEFYDFCRHLDLARNFQFPTLKQPPPSFLATMEEYIREAPTMGSISIRRLEYKAVEEVRNGDSESLENNNEQIEDKKPLLVEHEPKPEPQPDFKPKKDKDVPPLISANNCNDLLGLNQINPQAQEIDESNSMALAIVQNGSNSQSLSIDWNEIAKKPGWELALVEKNINNTNNTPQTKLDGESDKFLLESLYEHDTARKQLQLQNAGYNTINRRDMQYNPFGQQPPPQLLQNPFIMSSGMTPPMNMQVMMLHQQQQQHPYQNGYPQLYHQPYQQQNMFITCNNRHAMRTSNPFGDVYENPQSSTTS